MDKDFMKEWDERYAKAQELFATFKSTYEKVPGVMDITDDDWFGDTFLISIDSKRFVEGSIPKDFDGILVQFLPIYEALASYKEIIEKTRTQVPANYDLTSEPFGFFIDNIERLTKLITEYERNL